MGQKTGEIPVDEISDLIKTGNELYELLEENSTAGEYEYQRKRNTFVAEYSKWYSRCLPVIRSMLPDKAVRFETLYHTNKRSGTNEYTYTIQDYIQGIYFKDRPKNFTDSIAAKRIKEQKNILLNAIPRTSDFSFEMEKFVRINPINNQSSDSIITQEKLLDLDFEDEHYNAIRTEINTNFKRGFTISAFLLSRELVRNLMLDLIRIRFPPSSGENINLYYDPQNNTHRELRVLVGLIRQKKDAFDLNPEALDHLADMIEIMEPKTKPSSHSFFTVPTRENLEKCRINEISELLVEMIDFTGH